MEMMPLEGPRAHPSTSSVDRESQLPTITTEQPVEPHQVSSAPLILIDKSSSATLPNTQLNAEPSQYQGEINRNATSTILGNIDMESEGQDASAFNPLSMSSATTSESSLPSAHNSRRVNEGLQSNPNALENGTVLPLADHSSVATRQITSQNHTDTEPSSTHLNLRRRFTLNVQQQYSTLISWVLMLIFAIFLCYYFYEILIALHPQVGKLNPKPGNTNFIVAVLAQVFGGLMISLYLNILNVLHLQLLSRPKGALMLEAEQLARSTGALATVRMIFLPGRHHAWTLLRIALPVLMIVIGTIQKIHAGIIYEITPYNGTILVWAGLTQMNPVVLESIPTSTMAVYFLAWTPNLLSVPQFIWTLPPTDQCTNNCVTYIQPGGVEIARLWSKDLNQTLLQNGHFDLADVIQIYNAPAIVTEFDEPTDDLIFQTGECELFTPLSNDAIYICIKPAEFGTAVIGWTICPSAHYWTGTCVSNVSWTDEISQATTVATYTQFTTTSYYNKNLSIINVIETSPREILPIDINGFKATWAKLFNPGNNTSPVANPFMVEAVQFELGFYLRLGTDDFPNAQQSPLQILRNFITVPLQFYTTALQYMNATVGGVDIPDDMRATASAALGHWRWKAQLWTVAIWIGIAGILLLSSGGMVLWILVQDPVPVKSTAFPHLDMVSLAGSGCQLSDSRITLADLARTNDLANMNTREMIEVFQNTRGYIIQAECTTGAHENPHIVFVVRSPRPN